MQAQIADRVRSLTGDEGEPLLMRFIAEEISQNTYVNIMPQYRPCGKAFEIKELSTGLSVKEYEQAVKEAITERITRFD